MTAMTALLLILIIVFVFAFFWRNWRDVTILFVGLAIAWLIMYA